MRKSKFLEQSSGGGGWVCKPIKVMRTQDTLATGICRGDYYYKTSTFRPLDQGQKLLIYRIYSTIQPFQLLTRAKDCQFHGFFSTFRNPWLGVKTVDFTENT